MLRVTVTVWPVPPSDAVEEAEEKDTEGGSGRSSTSFS